MKTGSSFQEGNFTREENSKKRMRRAYVGHRWLKCWRKGPDKVERLEEELEGPWAQEATWGFFTKKKKPTERGFLLQLSPACQALSQALEVQR
jgi:hypothetical protein